MKKRSLNNSSQRALLNEMLPFEVPPSFSNGGFFNFLSKHNVRLTSNSSGENTYVEWVSEDESLDAVISIIFNVRKDCCITTHTQKKAGKEKEMRKHKLEVKALITRPFHFEISHKEGEFRRLSIVHPRNQLGVANFIYDNSNLITYYGSLSPFSLRKPTKIARSVCFDDALLSKRTGPKDGQIEEFHKEYKNIASFFSYEKYSNIYRFYESYSYQRAEKIFGKLLKLDISKCFDSIYTHSITWALLGNQAVKDNLKRNQVTFGDNFDSLMQRMNNNETNGIVIGPEFSRIFSELILQHIDSELKRRLLTSCNRKHKVDYRIYRYVDDYFVFYKEDEVASEIQNNLQAILKEFKLSLNTGKSERLERPIITSLTIAKSRISILLKEEIRKEYIEKKSGIDEPLIPPVFSPKVYANKLIIGFKTLLVETKTSYNDTLNLTLASVEKELATLCSSFTRNKNELKKAESGHEPCANELVKALRSLFEFTFFIYSSKIRVTFTIRIVRSISTVVDKLTELALSEDQKDVCYKIIHENITSILRTQNPIQYLELETLYLVHAINKLGKNYRMSLSLLASYFGFTYDKEDEVYIAPEQMNVFAITTLLLTIRNKNRYELLKAPLEEYILQKFNAQKPYLQHDSELLILYLDLICCRYITKSTKRELNNLFGVNEEDANSIIKSNLYWFTNWQDFDLSLELDKKRVREVY